jgi:hypothetical protein
MALARVLVATSVVLLSACGDDSGSGDSSGAGAAGSGGTGASGTGASGTGASGTGASGTGASGTGASGTGASGTGASGTGGGLPDCVTDTLLLAEYGKDYDCDWVLPGPYEDGDINLVLEVGGSQQQLCWLASSQGCDMADPGGWWYGGSGVLLCDLTCSTLVETPGAKLYVWLGCPNDTCY